MCDVLGMGERWRMEGTAGGVLRARARDWIGGLDLEERRER